MVMETRQRGAGTFGLAPVLYNTIHDHALGIAGCSSFTAYSVVLCIDHTYEVTYGAVLGVQLQRVTCQAAQLRGRGLVYLQRGCSRVNCDPNTFQPGTGWHRRRR